MENASFTRLVAPHLDDMVRVATVLVGLNDAEDLMQEATLRAWQGWGELRDAGAVRTWLLRILVNTCHNWRKGRAGTHLRRTTSLEGYQAELLALSGQDPGSSDHANALDLYRAMLGLEPELYQVVALRYFAELDATEIGLAFGVPASTIRSRLRKALSLLRSQLIQGSPLVTVERSVQDDTQ